jgi:RNA polymerase sigma-70 factor (ECF subfamily)
MPARPGDLFWKRLASPSYIFLEARAETSRAPCADTESLDRLLNEICHRAHAAHPKLTVADEIFIAHLARCGAQIENKSEALHAADLYLATACLQGDETAVATLVESSRRPLAVTLGRIDPSKSFVEEAAQRFWDAALVGTMSTPPRLSLYSGRGSLAGWIAVSAQRIALMMKRSDDAEGRARRMGGDPTAILQDPELAFIKERYRDLFEAATQRALGTLDDRERMIFRLHLLDGLTIERISRTYGVNHSTVSRWFATAREKVMREIQRTICEDLKASMADFESLRRLVVSQLDVSVALLAKDPATIGP